MRRRVTIGISLYCLILIILCNGSGVASVAVEDQINQSGQSDESYRIGNGFINGAGEVRMNGLITLLQEMGLDISYGEDGGTVFSMVDQSLARIITDLSSGNAEGFMDIPLIQETLKYLGISPADIIINPDDVNGHMDAIERYNQKYAGAQNSSSV